jgi:hypothetical protein
MAHMPTPDRAKPEITQDMRVAALDNPNSWLYVIDPALEGDDEVPPWGVIGAYPVNGRGQIEEDFQYNREYRPAPPPDLERLLELVGAGEREQRELLPAVLAGRLLLYAAGPEDTSVTGFPDRRHGTVMVPVCTSPARVPPTWPGWREIIGRDLVPLLGDHPLVINPGGPVTAAIPARDLAAAG